MRKALVLKRETLTELTGDQLAGVVGGTTTADRLLTAMISRFVDVSTPTLDDTCI